MTKITTSARYWKRYEKYFNVPTAYGEPKVRRNLHRTQEYQLYRAVFSQFCEGEQNAIRLIKRVTKQWHDVVAQLRYHYPTTDLRLHRMFFCPPACLPIKAPRACGLSKYCPHCYVRHILKMADTLMATGCTVKGTCDTTVFSYDGVVLRGIESRDEWYARSKQCTGLLAHYWVYPYIEKDQEVLAYSWREALFETDPVDVRIAPDVPYGFVLDTAHSYRKSVLRKLGEMLPYPGTIFTAEVLHLMAAIELQRQQYSSVPYGKFRKPIKAKDAHPSHARKRQRIHSQLPTEPEFFGMEQMRQDVAGGSKIGHDK